MIQYITSGELHFEIEGVKFVAKEGELVLLDCKKPHCYWAQQRCEVKWFHFNGDAVQALADYIFLHNKTGRFDGFGTKKVIPYVDAVMELLRMEKENSFQIAKNLYSMMCELCALSTAKRSSADVMIEKAVQYMNENFARFITVQSIAEYVGLSVFYFTRLFKRQMQISPHAYLNRMRINKAKKLLSYTYYSVEEIAGMAGFQSASHFIRAFKKSLGITPKKFREYTKGRKDE